MKVHEQKELEKIMRQSLAETQGLPKDKRVIKAGIVGSTYCKSKKLRFYDVLNIFDEKGNITTLTGDKALSYLIAGMAVGLVEESAQSA